MNNYVGGANVVTATGIFLLDNAFLTYLVLFAAVLGFAALVRNMGVIRAAVFSFRCSRHRMAALVQCTFGGNR
jgi:hypothetical protein